MDWRTWSRQQGGLVSRRQLEAEGLSHQEIQTLTTSRRLEFTRAQGIYRAGGAPHTPETPAWFAVLTTRSPLSYVSAARWWGLPVESDGLVHVTRLGRRRLAWPPGVRVHRVALSPGAVTQHRGLELTSRCETLLDCMGWLRFGEAASLADRAIQQRWITPEDIERRLEGQPGRWGNRQLRRLGAHLGDGAAAVSERRLHQILRDAGLSGWTPNLWVVIDGRRIQLDVAFVEHRLAIEVDGRRYHSEDDRFQADRTKQNLLVAAGWTVLRFTWSDLHERPDRVAGQIRALLAA